jgi:single-strand DNA-binding protein
MATTITGKLNKHASIFQAGESTGFGIRLGVKYFDRESKTEQWCNYEAVVFAKGASQVQFYQQALVEGAIVEVSGDKQRIKQFQGQNGLNLSIEILDARLGVVYNQQQPAPAQRPNQPAYNPQPAPNQHNYSNQPNPQHYNQQPNQPHHGYGHNNLPNR